MKSILVAGILALSAANASAQDWTGAYGVLAVSDGSGTSKTFSSGVLSSSFDISGHGVSLAYGYNVQNGALVYGGELAYDFGKTYFDGLPDTDNYDGMLDLKGRVGYASGKFVVYGVLGYSRSQSNYSLVTIDDPIAISGMSYGIGGDLAIGERVFVGLEYLRRNLEIGQGGIGGFPDDSEETDLKTISLRLGMRF